LSCGLLTPSITRFSKIHTLTSFPVVLCVPLRTFHNPTESGLRLDDCPCVAAKFKDDELGVEVGVVWMVYAERDDDFPKRDVVAAANMTSVLNPMFRPCNQWIRSISLSAYPS
jgi:hypothetical protein